ncbi:hypothetical protein DXG01_015303 [Tephrocybe rancida]|nr:hypothetical protein DXG01_015303 [Tephrocybe rancida]
MSGLKLELYRDPDTDAYSMFVKFGDGRSGKLGETQYQTHNPSFTISRKSTGKKEGADMESTTLEKLSHDYKAKVRHLKSRTENDLEWYEIIFGKDKENAIAGKKSIRKIMEEYPAQTNKESRTAYATRYITEVKTYIKELKSSESKPESDAKDPNSAASSRASSPEPAGNPPNPKDPKSAASSRVSSPGNSDDPRNQKAVTSRPSRTAKAPIKGKEKEKKKRGECL